MIVRIKYKVLGVCCGKQLPTPLAYNGEMCVLQRFDDEKEVAVYLDDRPEPARKSNPKK